MDFITLLVAEGTDFSLAGMWEQMGTAARSVLVILIAMFLVGFTIMVERGLAFVRARQQSTACVLAIKSQLEERKHEEALATAKRFRDSPIARVLERGLDEYIKGIGALREEGPEDLGDFDLIDAVNRQMERAKERATANLKRGLTVLATVGSTAPFVGLLGTVVGIINAFQGLSSDGGGGLSSVAGGISEALVATAVGLFVAIPAVAAFNLLNGRVEAFQIDMNDIASEIIDHALKEGRYL